MEDLGNSIKRILYDYLQTIPEEKFQNYIIQKQSSTLIQNIISNCYSKIILLDGDIDEKTSVIATSLLHYLLTNILIPSNRKISHDEIDLDIIIPDLITLINFPKNSLVIYIPKNSNEKEINNYLKKLQKLQPNKENVWIVLPQFSNINAKQYILNESMNSFGNILNDIEKFLANKKQTKLKIFKN